MNAETVKEIVPIFIIIDKPERDRVTRTVMKNVYQN